MRQLAEHRKSVQTWRELEKRVADLVELMPLAADDASLGAELESEVEKTRSPQAWG